MSDKLAEIIAHKKKEIEPLLLRADKLRYAALERNEFRSLASAIDLGGEKLGLIAEVKKASPSAGIIAEDFDPVMQAKKYASAGASAISVLTDSHFFGGSNHDLKISKEIFSGPVLRKDFIIDEFQIIESKSLGADVILLIASALTKKEIKNLSKLAKELSLEVLVEIHCEKELDKAFCQYVDLIGVNNRDLKTFKTDINISS